MEKKGGRAFVLGAVHRLHPLLVLIDADAFRAHRLAFHRIEGLAFDGDLAFLRDRNIQLRQFIPILDLA